MKQSRTQKLIYTAVCIAIGLLLPQMLHMFPIASAGSVLLPMHIPVLICGFLCGYRYGAFCGFILPLLSFALTGMPPIFPIGVSMMLELAAYGALTGILYHVTKGKIYLTLIGAMIGGRIILGIANTFLFGFTNIPYGMEAFIAGAFVTALPGIIIQLVLIPAIIYAVKKARFAHAM